MTESRCEFTVSLCSRIRIVLAQQYGFASFGHVFSDSLRLTVSRSEFTARLCHGDLVITFVLGAFFSFLLLGKAWRQTEIYQIRLRQHPCLL